jgi:hypothetical protein
VGAILHAALPPAAKGKVFSVDLIRRKWSAAVGEEIARRSEPASFERGLLTVRVEEPAWGRVIVRMQSQITTQLNQALGQPLVRKLRFVKDGVAVHAPEPAPPPRAPLPDVELSSFLWQASEAIPDPELREVVRRAAAHYLAAHRR